MKRFRAALALLVVAVCVVATARGAGGAADSGELPRTASHLGVRIGVVPNEIQMRGKLRDLVPAQK